MLEDIRRVLGIRPNTDAAEYLDSILEAYKVEQEEAENWATSSEGKGAFEKFGQQLIVMAHRVTIGAALARNFGHDWESRALELHDGLLALGQDFSKLADQVKAGGGPGNLYTRQYGPPEWRLAIDLAALYRNRKPTRTRDDFIAFVYSPAIKFITGKEASGMLSNRMGSDAYRVAGRALPVFSRINEISSALSHDPDNREQLKRELGELQAQLSQIKAPYPFLFGRQPGT